MLDRARMSVLLDIQGLSVDLSGPGRTVEALRDLCLSVRRREMLGLVGESGSGKSVLGLMILGLLPKAVARVRGGRILWEGRDLLRLGEEELGSLRGGQIALIVQEPHLALNPVIPVGRQVAEVLERHGGLDRERARQRSTALLKDVELGDGEQRWHSFPHELSGGQRQRVLLAMALAGNPRLIIADEPTTALDPPVQAQVLSLLRRTTSAAGASVLLISHDLALLGSLCSRLAVMHAGQIVEVGPSRDLCIAPAHPYTAALLVAARRLAGLGPDEPTDGSSDGSGPGLAIPASGDAPACRYAPRCPRATDTCLSQAPASEARGPERAVACHHPLEPS